MQRTRESIGEMAGVETEEQGKIREREGQRGWR